METRETAAASAASQQTGEHETKTAPDREPGAARVTVDDRLPADGCEPEEASDHTSHADGCEPEAASDHTSHADGYEPEAASAASGDASPAQEHAARREARRRDARDRRRRRIYALLAAAFAVVFVISLVQIVRTMSAYRAATEVYDTAAGTYTDARVDDGPAEPEEETPPAPQEPEAPKPPITVDFEALTAVNDDIIGWIYIEDTVVNYPLLQGADNYYYLNVSYLNAYLVSGSIYLDCDNSRDLDESHAVIFGHNMKNHTMFGDLDMYLSDGYLAAHPYVDILLADGTWLRYQIYAARRAHVEDGTFSVPLDADTLGAFIETSQKENLLAPIAEAEGFELPAPTADDHILTLSTCTEDSADAERFVLHAVRIDTGAEIDTSAEAE